MVEHAPRLRLHPEFRSAWLERRPRARDLAAVVNCPRTQLGRWTEPLRRLERRCHLTHLLMPTIVARPRTPGIRSSSRLDR